MSDCNYNSNDEINDYDYELKNNNNLLLKACNRRKQIKPIR